MRVAAFREVALGMMSGALAVMLDCGDSTATESVRGTAPPPPPSVPIPVPEFIFVANADGSGAVQRTAGGQPSWSPDGRRVVFRRYTMPGFEPDLCHRCR